MIFWKRMACDASQVYFRCAGSATIELAGREYRLEDFTPVAHLPDGWSDAWVEGLWPLPCSHHYHDRKRVSLSFLR